MNTRCLLIKAVVGASVLTAWGPSTAFGQCEITPVTGTGVGAGAQLGYSTGISGDYAVVGAYKSDSTHGAAYIYERDGLDWIEIGRLLPEPLLADGDEYGRAVAISGGVAVVASRKRRIATMSGRGAVYVFRRSPAGVWEYEKELTASDGLADDAFGSSVAIDGDWIVVGAPDNDEFGLANSGTAYAYHFDGSTWVQARKFRAGDQDEGDKFANAVAISGNWVIVGTKVDGDGCPEGPDAAASGSVYTFFHDPAAAPNAGWAERTKLKAQFVDGATVTCDAGFSDNFGYSVAISGDRLVVGAVFNDDDGTSSGSAYVYRLEEPDWVIEQKLIASDGAAGDNFGRDVAIHGDLVLVGASKGDQDDPLIADSGSAYLYRRSGSAWIDDVELTASDAAASGRFGWHVSIGGDYAIIGAYKQGGKGAAYVLAVGAETDCDENGVHDDCDVLGDSSLDANNNGTLDSCECATDGDCVSALACISGTCDDDTSLCVFTVNAGSCAIAGTCFPDDRLNEDNDCEVCNHAASDSGWSNRDEGLSCGDTSDSTCDHPDTCDGEGVCRTNPEPVGTVCADEGNECTHDRCDGAGDCGHPAVADSTPCTPDGNECTDNQCQSGQCSVVFLMNGSPCGDPSNSVCNPADSCDGAGTCLDNERDDGTLCFHDGLFCTGEDSCQGGVCDSAGDPCTAEGLICDANAEAFHECSCDPAVEGACDDGVFCTGLEACFGGACFSAGDPCPGLGLFCEEVGARCVECRDVADCADDGNDCTETVCRDGACEHDALADDTPCGSGLNSDCTNPDTCAGGVCDANHEPAGTACGDPSDTECDPADTCDGAGTCADNIPADGTLCTDDGVFCTGEESCQDGVCEHEGDPCTAPGLICDAVAEQNGTCSCDGDAACDDGEYCNGSETCGATGSCEAGTDPCEPGEFCDEGNDICKCDSHDDCAEDGLFCNGEEICSGGVCISAGDPCLSIATTPVCIEATNSCECGSHAHCDNGRFCDGAETCVNGACQSGAVPCTADESCNDQSDVCEECESGDDDACDDGDSCTTDRCPFGVCHHETLPECKDGDEDGVINSKDLCPGTPPDAEVDAIGCTCADAIDRDHDGVIDCDDLCDDTPLDEAANSGGCSCSQLTVDSDGDGVPNGCDDCAGTPSGEAVDETGCGQSQIDSDQDGVKNDADACSGTPLGSAVDETGCAQSQIDSDQDGVMNNVDACPDTPPGSEVDGTGCAQSQIDSDEDGVTDDVDACPGTPPGIEVGDDGCAVPVDNGNDNDNDNSGDNGNDNEPGQGLPDEPAPSPCGLFGMINLVFLGLGMVAMRMTRSRHRRSRR